MAIDSDVDAAPLEAGNIEFDFVPKARATVTSTQLDEDLVLMNREDGNVCVLNQTGALIWSCFDGEVTLGDLGLEPGQAAEKISGIQDAEARKAGEVIEDDGSAVDKVVAFLQQAKYV